MDLNRSLHYFELYCYLHCTLELVNEGWWLLIFFVVIYSEIPEFVCGRLRVTEAVYYYGA